MYGSSFENFLVAVVVPKEDHLRTAVEQQGVTDALSMPFQVRVVVLCLSRSGELWVVTGCGSVSIVGLCRSRSGGLWVFAGRGSLPFWVRRVVGLYRSWVCANCGSVPFQFRRVVGLCRSWVCAVPGKEGCGSCASLPATGLC